jgi:quinol-cytochrome oxidoreductase complex cytochrome b subunit
VNSAKRWINYIQVVAAIGLGLSYFLPFYKSAVGEIRYVDEWGFFIWPFPILYVLYKISNRWLKAALCLLAIIGGLLALFFITFLATYKSTGFTGYNIAKASIIILVISWLVLGVISLFAPRHKQAV